MNIQERGHGVFSVLQALLLTICLTGSGGAWAFVGDYQRAAPANGWHTGTLTRVAGSESDYKWTNRAGVSWNLTMNIGKGELILLAPNPIPNPSTTQTSFKLVTDSAGLIGYDFGGERYLRIAAISDVLGQYQRNPVQSGWDSGTISLKPGSTTILRWTNGAGRSWDLTPDLVNKLLRTDASNPYQNTPGGQNFSLQESRGVVAGFRFFSNLYAKTPVPQPIHTQNIGSFLGAEFDGTPPATTTYGAGYSYYSAIWPLTQSPLTGFQVGLPGTWVMPDNRDFTQALLAPGHNQRTARAWDGPNWDESFQSIEGSAGSWISTQFQNATPKYRVNSTPDGYLNQISSPGWGWQDRNALPASIMGLAQLSNRILLPPDGMTFSQSPNVPNGQMLGLSWMTLPLIPAIDGAGTQAWTFFMNSSNFNGPVAFYVPQTFARYSKIHSPAVGRGLDALPARVNPPKMEIGTVPMKVQYSSSNGKFYGRIPRMQFPNNGNGVSNLATDFALYSKAALSNGVDAWWMKGGSAPVQTFITSGRLVPKLKAETWAFHLNVDGGNKSVNVGGFMTRNVYNTGTTINPKQSFGLQWTSTPTMVWPEYYVLNASTFEPIAANLLPADITLGWENFAAKPVGSNYTSNSTWNSPAPVPNTTTTVALNDGSKVTYAWYKFVDQPSVQGFGWTAEQKATIQARIEKIHSSWSSSSAFMEAPSVGTLATMDTNLFVTPPTGKTIGYVPIVIGQSKQ
jgi:hypothetical protein